MVLTPNLPHPQSGAVRPHSHLRISMFTQHFVDILDLTKTPLDFMCETYKDATREDMRKFLGTSTPMPPFARVLRLTLHGADGRPS